MKKYNYDRYVPLGINGTFVFSRMGIGLGAATAFSLSFLFKYANAWNELFRYRNGKRYLIEGAQIAPFSEICRGSFWAFGVMFFVLLFVVVWFYFYHSQGSCSIYTMKRLPNRWELWKRVVTIPLLGIAACIVTMPLLKGLYYLIYLFCTPKGCLP